MLLQGGSAEVELVKGQTFKLSTDKAYMEKGNAQTVYVDYENISKVLKPGNRVYVDDGLISLIVTAISKCVDQCISRVLIVSQHNFEMIAKRDDENL